MQVYIDSRCDIRYAVFTYMDYIEFWANRT